MTRAGILLYFVNDFSAKRRRPGNGVTITMRDVARAAGVAEKTVSRVINNERYVSEDARARVEAAIAALGYAPNAAAQRLAANRAFTIAVVVDTASGGYLAPMFFSMIDAAMARNYAAIVVRLNPENPASLALLANLARRKQADGALLPALWDEKQIDLAGLLPPGFPVVQRGGGIGSPRIPSVAAELREGAAMMAEHLLDLGHRRIAFVCAEGPRSTKDRLGGFLAAMAQRAVPVDPRYVVMPEGFGFAAGFSAGNSLLRLNPRPTAIFAANDGAATGVLTAAREAGLAAPDDVSVAGFDDHPIAAESRPALTTVRLPIDEMGQRAADMLIDLIEGRGLPERHVRLPVSLMIRESTGPCPESH